MLAHARAGLAIAREHDLPLWVGVAITQEGLARCRSGDRKIGGEMMDGGLRLVTSLGTNLYLPMHFKCRAEALADEQPEAAMAKLHELLNSTAATGQRWIDAEIHRARGGILARCFPERIEPAEAAFEQALAVSRIQQTRSFELRASLDLARLYRDTGREREARDLLCPALVGFTETPELPEIGEAQRLLASLG